MTGQYEQTPIGIIVRNNHQTAAIFERYGLDFCCGGRTSLADACRQHQVDLATIVRELEMLGPSDTQPPTEDTSALVDHIVTRHHEYVRTAIRSIQRHLAKVVAVHSAQHPELEQVAQHFDRLADELTLHMVKEEHVLFPYVRALAAGQGEPPDIFGTVENPIRMMELEHQEAGDHMHAIRQLLAGYEIPEDACTTYRLLLAELSEFERDLHLHVHLENNVLFPQAVALENQHTWRGLVKSKSLR